MSLISPEALAEALEAARRDPTGATSLRIVDTRWYLLRRGDGRRAYDAGHIPGAIFLDLDTDLSAPEGPGRHPLPDPAELAARLGAAGIGDEHLVVAYDDVGGTVAARLWWMLDVIGLERVAVLDGGLVAWVRAGNPITTEVPRWPPATLTLAPAWSRTIDRETLRSRLGEVVLLDARAGERYRGEVEPVDPAAGHIPTARSAPTSGNLGADGRFLPPDELAARFAAFGVEGGEVGSENHRPAGSARRVESRSVVVSCGSGTNACHHALAMRVAGLPDPILYPGSFSDWSGAGLPVATGLEPGLLPGPSGNEPRRA